MKKKSIVLGLIAIGIGWQANAQKYDENKVLLALTQKKYADAQAELDKAASDPKKANTPEILAFKTKIASDILSAVDTVPSLKTQYPNAEADFIQAFSALKAAVPDTSKFNAFLKSSNTWSIGGVNKVYGNSFNRAVQEFNGKNYLGAFQNFKNADIYGGFLIDNGFTQNQKGYIDTTTILYAGLSAQYLDSANHAYGDTAITYYDRLFSKGIVKESYVSIYDWLIGYYDRKNDTASAAKYLAEAKKNFPKEMEYWNGLETRKMTQGQSPEALLEAFNQKKGTLTEDQYIAFGNAFSEAKQKSEDKKKGSVYGLAQIEAYKYALGKAPANEEYAHAVGHNYAVQWNDLKDDYSQIKGATPDSKAKRLAIKKEYDVIADSAILYLTKYYDIAKQLPTRTRKQTSDLNASVDALYLLYSDKKEASAGRNAKDYAKYEALAAKYEKEHGMYK